MKDAKIRTIEALIVSVIVLLAISLECEFQFTMGADEGQDAERLPMIWPCIGRDKSYHIMFQLQILNSTERLVIEEWASFESEQFRLDLISNDRRISYLMDGKTGQVYSYQPFTCNQLKPDSNDLGVLRKLFKGYKLDNSTDGIAYGLGPLWLRAQAEGRSSRDGESRKRSLLTPNYVIYKVEFKDPGEGEVPYRLRFHFKLEQYQFVDMVEWLDDSQVDGGKEADVMARAKVIIVDVNSRIPNSTFELPVGYGCTSEDRLHPLPAFAGNSLPSYHEFGQGVFELTLSKPRDDQFQSWDSRKFTVQVLYGGLKLNEVNRDYNAVSVQWQDLNAAKGRTKFVWSVVNRYEKDARSRQANIYIIDEDSNKCKLVHDYYRNFVLLGFPGQQTSRAGPMSLSMDSISQLFAMDSGFYLIRENSIDGLGQLRESWHEKRIDNYKELDADGSIIWSGPISVVNKMVSYYHLPLDHERAGSSSDFVHRFHETITVFFYSDDYSTILYKLVGEFDDSTETDLRSIQRQMDVSACFEPNKREDIVIKYPIDSQEANKNLRPLKNMVEDLFCMNLFGTTPVQPLQVANIEASFDTFFMYITLTFLDLPASQAYELQRGKTLIEGSDKSAMIEKRSRDADSCAQSCDHYSCYRYSFDRSTRHCRLEVRENGAVVSEKISSDLYELIKLELDPQSAWSRLFGSASARAHLRPQELLDMLNRFVAYNGSYRMEQKHQRFDDTVGEVPLVLRLPTELLIGANQSHLYEEMMPGQNLIWTELRPISVQANVESMSEFIRESDSTVRVMLDASTRDNLQIEYTLLVQGREFRDSAYKLIETMDSYEDCAQLCQASDCRSFSYCEHNRQCRTSELHREKSIQLATYYEPRCEVFVLDYLSKFEQFGLVVAPVKGIKRSLELVDERECAQTCMEETNFNCQGFYHCQKRNGIRDCLLVDKHVNDQPKQDRSRLIFTSQLDPQHAQLLQAKCMFYSRSYLAQFDRYLGRMFELPSELVESTTMIDEEDAEGCARLCIENSCLAFDVCLEPRINKGPRQMCQFVHQEVRKAHLRERSQCTTYVLSDRSQFNLDKKSLIFGEPSDRPALDKPTAGAKDVVFDEKRNESESNDEFSKLLDKFQDQSPDANLLGQSSAWLSKLISLGLGILLGVGSVLTWRQSDTIYLFVTRFTSRTR